MPDAAAGQSTTAPRDPVGDLSALSVERRALLAQLLRSRRPVDPAQPIRRRTAGIDAAATPAQRRMWFLAGLAPSGAAYHLAGGLRFHGPLEVRALERALAEIVRRHESLRTGFSMEGANLVQRVEPTATVDVAIEDLRAWPAADRDAALQQRATQLAQAAFALDRPPLMRAAILRLAADDHALIVVLHHIISDGRSIQILHDELGALYDAYRTGRESPLAGPMLQYGDYAEWLRELGDGAAIERDIQYWCDQLRGRPPRLSWPGGAHERRGLDGSRELVEIDSVLYANLQRVGREHGMTLYMIVLAALQVLLHRHTGEHDIWVGAPVDGRRQAGTDALVGLFVNTVVMRSDLAGDPTLAELLGRVRDVALGAYAHQTAPYERVVEALHPDRHEDGGSLFHVMLAMQHLARSSRGYAGLAVEALEFHTGTAKFDLSFLLAEHANGMRGCVEYSSELFDASAVGRLVRHWIRVLQTITDAPTTRISAIPLLDADERRALLIAGNHLPSLPERGRMHDLFARQAAETPDRVGVTCADEHVTYGGLARRSKALASRLRASGVRPEVRVAVWVPRQVDLIVAFLGVLEAGGVYVPLDAAQPRERLEWMMRDAGVAVLLTGPAPVAPPPAIGIPEVRLCDAVQPQELDEGTNDLQPENLAYILYTSGSTGVPKGVMVGHASGHALLRWAVDTFDATALGGVLASSSIGFDISIFELLAPISAGGRIVIAGNALELFDVRGADVTLVNTVPSAMSGLLRLGPLPPSVQTVNLAGEELPPSVVQALRAQSRVRRVLNLYGPTEATIYATGYSVAPGDWQTIPIGRPLDHMRAYVLDRSLELVPIGVQGELYLAGVGLARGYVNRPGWTADRFVPDPFGDPGERLYRTGDVARWRSDGTLEYVSRRDRQVKIRGHRIELGEVEATIRRHPAIGDAAVVVREHQGERALVAYVTLPDAAPPETRLLQSWSGEHLPSYMVPARWVVLPQLPRTPAGKIDRAALPMVDGDAGSVDVNRPRTMTEDLLATIWRDVLDRRTVGTTDNFFEIGGHSLLATQIVARVREAFGVDLPLRQIFETPTVAALSEWMASATAGHRPHPPIRRTDANPVKATAAQRRMWVLEQMAPGAYHVAGGLRLRGGLDVDALSRAVAELVRRHESLRTSVELLDSALVQRVDAEATVSIDVGDLRAWPADDREPELRRRAERFAEAPFALDHAPLLRVSVQALSDEDHVVLVVLHHIVSDGWSLDVLQRELAVLYDAYRAGRASPLPAVAVHFRDYAAWEADWLASDAIAEDARYWQAHLSNCTWLVEWPGRPERPRPPVVRREAMTLDAALDAAIARLAARHGATPFIVLLTALDALLHRWSGQREFVVGTVSASRTRPETDGTVGCFVNFLPLRASVSAEVRGIDLLHQARQTVIDACSHQDCPFEWMFPPSMSAARRDAPYNVALVMPNYRRLTQFATLLAVEPYDIEPGRALLDLRFIADQTADGLHLLCEYDGGRFDAGEIRAALDGLTRVLMALAEAPEQRIEEISLPATLRPASDVVERSPIAIAATFTAEPLESSMQFWLNELDLAHDVRFMPPNTVFQQVLDPASVMARNSKGVNVMLLRLEDWAAATHEAPDLVRNIEDFVEALRTRASAWQAMTIVVMCPPSRAALAEPDRRTQLQRAEQLLTTAVADLPGLLFVGTSELSEYYPVLEYDDVEADRAANMPYSAAQYAALGTMVCRRAWALQAPPCKVIALDADRTLWNDVCGEVGPGDVQVDEPRRQLQAFMRAQRDAGRLLCLCSKNNPEDVEEVFATHRDLPLSLDDFVAVRINWRPKHENLVSLATELAVGLEHVVFIDDDPRECAEAAAACPQLVVLQLPEDPREILTFLKHVWAFDTVRVTSESRRRRAAYEENERRREHRQTIADEHDFLASLALRVDIDPMSADQIARVSELSWRVNQFNLSGTRRTESELLAAWRQNALAVHVVRARDRFGDYGLVGVVIFRVLDRVLDVDSWLLSCRALGRRIEHRMLAWLGIEAQRRGCHDIELRAAVSRRNRPILEFLQQVIGDYKISETAESSAYRVPSEAAAMHESRRPLATQTT